ncbi:hypothetical protein B0J17DRAFT_667546 [Rhizoctonia solani]|nr:hypothetical protein B0J17DRAFT_667546 [Rhizoctonia solani]
MMSDCVIVRNRKNYLATVFPQDTTFTPPTLPVHVAIQLEPVTGTPSDEEIIKVQQAIRSYHQFANVPSIFDSHVNMELSQHLFNIQMARYTQHAAQSRATSASHQTPILSSSGAVERIVDLGTGLSHSGNNAGIGAKQANQLIERSNQIAERTNVLTEQTSHPAEQANKPAERFNDLFERMNQHFEQSNRLAKESMQPVEKLGEVLGNINRVLVRIQHAIIRSYKGNKVSALNCLVNEKGETPCVSHTTMNLTFADFKYGDELPVWIGGDRKEVLFAKEYLEPFLCFYGIENGLRNEIPDSRETMLSDYLSSCLG